MSNDQAVRDYHDTRAVVEDVACTLNEAEAAQRGDWVEAEFLPHLDRVEERDDGFVLLFPHTEEALEAALTAIALESRCCSEQSFTLEVPAGDELRLAITGPDGTKELAREGFFEMFEDAPEPV
jgi:hypothetical protein